MHQEKKSAISPTRKENFPEWYQAVIQGAELAEHSPVRGCMIIKPWGYGIWENIQKGLDKRFKALGHQNAYFPLFIPLSFLEKEAQHVEGFAKECAVVTHHRLTKNEEGKLVPDGELEEPLIIRPTSEMIIGEAFSRWIESYRDLPLLINQWSNVVRWEMRTRLFLRTTEILWQEGHTAHKEEKEAKEHALTMLGVYQSFAKEELALPLLVGKKTKSERFPGAVETYTIEAMMQDKKALQAGTSHFLGQNFSKACHIAFMDEKSQLQHAWTTSWGLTTRLIGAVVMMHSDDDGLILPPHIAAFQMAILPIIHKEERKEEILSFCRSLKEELASLSVRVLIDEKEGRGGEKKWGWIKKGIPIRIEIGLKEVEKGLITFSRRAFGAFDKRQMIRKEFTEKFSDLLQESHDHIYKKAESFLKENIQLVKSEKEFYDFFQSSEGGFALCYYAEDPNVEEKVQQDLSVTARCLLFEEYPEQKCIFSGKPTKTKAIFAKAY